MPRLTRRQLSTYVLASQMATTDHDILSALIPFFEPAFVKLRGQIFDPKVFLRNLHEVGVKFNLTTDIVEHLIPKFIEVGWLIEEASDNTEVVYRCQNSADVESKEFEHTTEAIIGEIGTKFSEFVDKLEPLSTQKKTIQQLEDMLLSWLVSVDGTSNNEIAIAAGSMLEKNDAKKQRSGIRSITSKRQTSIFAPDLSGTFAILKTSYLQLYLKLRALLCLQTYYLISIIQNDLKKSM